MILPDLSAFLNHLWQSFLFAGAIWLLTLTLRSNRASVRYWLWLAASAKFMIPFSLLVSTGKLIPWRAAPEIGQNHWPYVMEEISRPFTGPSVAPWSVPATPSPNPLLSMVLLAVWFCGFSISIAFWIRSWGRMRTAQRSATPLSIKCPIPVASSALRVEPGVFGIRKPILLLPVGLEDRLMPAQLEAIVAHEMCHVRRRDNLTGAIHMIIEAFFWFHPLVWWIRVRLVEERELACDEAVVVAGHKPHAYAEGILNVCKFYLEAPPCVAGVTGGDLKKRIQRILNIRRAANLNLSKKLLLASAGFASVGLPFIIGMLNATPSQAQAPATHARFEVASIKPRVDASSLVRIQPFPGGRLVVENFSLRQLIQSAYGVEDFQISGGPNWINSDRFDIQAKAEGNPPGKQMAGPMLQKLLEDRFRLTLHRETRQLAVYDLTETKSGIKLQRSKAGSCTPFLPDSLSPPIPEASQKRLPFCGFLGFGVDGSNRTLDALGISMTELASGLSRGELHRTIIDKTGLTGNFDVHLKWTAETFARMARFPRPDDQGPAMASPDSLPGTVGSLFTALQEQLGLNLKASSGPVQALVLDHAEKPSAN